MESNENGIQGKVVVITGASSGIGLTTAKLLAKKGAAVVLASRNKELLWEIAQEIASAGGKAIACTTDVTSYKDMLHLTELAVKTYGKLDVMINNAGLMAFAPMDKLKVDEWDRMIDINIKGVLYGIAAALPVFIRQNQGHIINLSSVAGIKTSGRGSAVYSGTKFAVRAITDSLRQELPGIVRTTSIEPGMVTSNLVNGTTDPESAKAVKTAYETAISPDAIAEAIAFAIAQPEEVSINEIVIRPSVQIL